jgi:tetratricopeptide (TPR) repeat protein
LVDLLLSAGEIDDALSEYLALADAYYQLMQLSKAVEMYKEALRLTPRSSDPPGLAERILRRMADLQMRTGDWPAASSTLASLINLRPDDERARLNIIDVLYKAGRSRQADKQTEALIQSCQAGGDHRQVINLLAEAVRRQPKQLPLRGRLARAYMDAGMRSEAVEQLDALGEMQLELGLHRQALTTVRAIIALQPPNVDAYQQLLEQIGG